MTTVPVGHTQIGAMPVVVDQFVPLTKLKRVDGKIVEPHVEQRVLFWIIFGTIHVHPERLEDFRVHVTTSARHPYLQAEPA